MATTTTPTADARGRLLDPAADDALSATFGASGSDLLITLFALASWPLTESDTDAVVVPMDAVVNHILEATILGEQTTGPERVQHAIALLTSTPDRLQAADWRPWQARSRRHRLLIQPLPTLSDGQLVVAPHFCYAAMTAYRSHLEQGQLPWTQPGPDEPALPRALGDALAAVRDHRNRDLEKEVVEVLRGAGWNIVSNIKKGDPQRLGVPALSGEIDAVTGRCDHHTIWLLEVKDPADTYVVPEIRRHLDTFFYDRDRKPSYATRLQRKVDELTRHVDAVAVALGLLPPRPGGYQLAAAFVTRKPVPAAFTGSVYPFASLPELVERLEPT